MKKYQVNVNGTTYEVELELLEEGAVSKAAPKAAPAAKPAGAGTQVTAPMPGNILSVNVTEGKTVKKGDVLMILEAMKMENEIMAPKDGKVTGVNVAKGATVESGSLLCTIA